MINVDISILLLSLGSVVLTYWALRHWIPDQIIHSRIFFTFFKSPNRQPGVFFGCLYVWLGWLVHWGNLDEVWYALGGWMVMIFFLTGPVSAWIFLSAIPRLRSTYQSGQPINEEEVQHWLAFGFMPYIIMLPVIVVGALVLGALDIMGIAPQWLL